MSKKVKVITKATFDSVGVSMGPNGPEYSVAGRVIESKEVEALDQRSGALDQLKKVLDCRSDSLEQLQRVFNQRSKVLDVSEDDCYDKSKRYDCPLCDNGFHIPEKLVRHFQCDHREELVNLLGGVLLDPNDVIVIGVALSDQEGDFSSSLLDRIKRKIGFIEVF